MSESRGAASVTLDTITVTMTLREAEFTRLALSCLLRDYRGDDAYDRLLAETAALDIRIFRAMDKAEAKS